MTWIFVCCMYNSNTVETQTYTPTKMVMTWFAIHHVPFHEEAKSGLHDAILLRQESPLGSLREKAGVIVCRYEKWALSFKPMYVPLMGHTP